MQNVSFCQPLTSTSTVQSTFATVYDFEVALFAAIRRARFLALGASCCVIRHHRSVLPYCIGGAVSSILGGARKSMAQQLEQAVWPWQGSHLKEVGAERAQEQESVRGFDPGENDVGRHELRESAGIRHVAAIGNCSWQSGALDHEGGARIVREHCKAEAFYLRTLRCVQFPVAVHKEERPDSRPQTFVHCPNCLLYTSDAADE